MALTKTVYNDLPTPGQCHACYPVAPAIVRAAQAVAGAEFWPKRHGDRLG